MIMVEKTAIVSLKAEIGENVKIGHNAIIYDDVQIGDNCVIGPNAVLYDGARLGKNVKIFQGASVSNEPQDLKFSGVPTQFYIGDGTVVREFATLHRGTEAHGFSKVGKDCLLMAYSHVAHDCVLGDNVILANSVQIGGHVELEDWVIIGGMTPIHQFVKIGKHAMVGGGWRVPYDVPPFMIAAGEPLKFTGVNIIGLRRRGFSNEQIESMKEVYRILFRSGKNLGEAKAELAQSHGDDPTALEIMEFMNSITRPGIK